ncbi:hypothetical protein DHEL01_v208156 [Diaporthe helianthi]|uniref:Uncharacterized protein n=1 Tax=Diaporthe helianthi TaxID=158607 RepID=A0A2P5HT62_DIAHE|nr:hypothetical protein DHEL01_v208156 [Diaporthe helianthi]
MASQTPTGASQRLLTMKFMQRAAAAAASPSSPSTPTSDDGRASKRRKTSGQSPMTPQTPSYVIDHKAAQVAREEEERKRQEHAARQAEKLGDSHWVLDAAKLPGPDQQAGKVLNVVQVGFSQIDSRRGEEDEQAGESSNDSSDSDSSDSGSSDSSSEDSAKEAPRQSGRASYGSLKRQEIHSRQSAERKRVQKLAKERRKKEVKLNTLTSISGGSNNFGRRK